MIGRKLLPAHQPAVLPSRSLLLTGRKLDLSTAIYLIPFAQNRTVCRAILVIDDHDLRQPQKAFSATLRGKCKGVFRGPSRPFVDKKCVLSGPSWPFVDQKRFSPRPFVDRPNYSLANLSSDKRQRALVQRLPSPLDPCNRSNNARLSTHDFAAPQPSRKSPPNPANLDSDNRPTLVIRSCEHS